MLIYFLFILNTFKVCWKAFTLTKKLWKKITQIKKTRFLIICTDSVKWVVSRAFQHHLSSGLINWLTGLSRDELPIDHSLFLSIFLFFSNLQLCSFPSNHSEGDSLLPHRYPFPVVILLFWPFLINLFYRVRPLINQILRHISNCVARYRSIQLSIFTLRATHLLFL